MLDSRLLTLKDLYKGKRGWLVCGGPSLKETDLQLIPTEDIILGANRVYLKEDTLFDFLFMGDAYTAEQLAPDFIDKYAVMNVAQLITSKGIYDGAMKGHADMWFVGHGERKFHTNVHEKIYGGRSITFVMMQFAYYMGFNEVYLLGVDHNWTFEGSQNVDDRVWYTHGKDTNHFCPEYYQGMTWFEPKYDEMEESFSMANEAYKKAGRVLGNASLTTKLSNDIIPQVKYLEIVGKE